MNIIRFASLGLLLSPVCAQAKDFDYLRSGLGPVHPPTTSSGASPIRPPA